MQWPELIGKLNKQNGLIPMKKLIPNSSVSSDKPLKNANVIRFNLVSNIKIILTKALIQIALMFLLTVPSYPM